MVRIADGPAKVTPLRHLLPHGLDVSEIVDDRKADTSRWLLSTTLRKMVNHDVDAKDFATLYSLILRRVMGRTHAGQVHSLIGAGVIERSPYRTGKSFGYRLTEEYLSRHPVWPQVVDPVLHDRLQKEFVRIQAEQTARRLPIHDALKSAQQGLTISREAARAVDQLPPKSQLCQRVHLRRLWESNPAFSVSGTGRVFNGLSGLKKELREHVRLDDEPLGCIDIGCSQPGLLGNLLTEKHPAIGVTGCATYKSVVSRAASFPAARAGGFLEVASSGGLYDELAWACGWDRARAKKRFLVDVPAKVGTYPSRVEDAFRDLFPDVWRAIQEINRDSHCNLIRLLQEMEAWLVIEQVCPRLVDRVPIVTLHDAIFCGQRDLLLVEDTFQEVLDDLGF